MRYAYYDLYDHQFEELVVAIGRTLLGIGIQPFSTGPDGGRDARFSGTAALFPSANNPLNGNVVVQAKHTEHPFAKFSDADFSSVAATSTLSHEIPRIRGLVEQGELDHYHLYSNRRLAGPIDQAIRTRIIAETGAKTVELFGIERIDSILKAYPRALSGMSISLVNAPLRVTPDDLAEVILALDKDRDTFEDAFEDIATVERLSFAEKNIINKLSEEFAKLIRTRYLSDFSKVRGFLANPANESILVRYEEAASEFSEQIIAHQNEIESFDQVLVHLQNLLFQRDGDLARNKRLTKLVIYYMYWNCDIGNENEEC